YVLGEVEVHALRGVNLTIERGEFVAVMGASGSGKSTLMNIVGCLDRPTSGQYLIEGEDVASLDETDLAAIRSKRVGFVFQSFNLLSRTSALENVELPLFYSSWTSNSEHRAQELLHMVGLDGRAQNHPNQLSGGQQQRVAIARALINRPSIVLADEPTGNLDSTSSAEVMDIITRLNRQQGITIILVTHDPDVAAYADRVVTFRDGQVISDTRKADAVQASAAAARRVDDEPAREPGGLVWEAWTFGAMALTAAARALTRNKMRAALTMLGIFIGVAAVVAMVAVGNGATSSVQEQIASLGTNLIIVLPGATTSNGVRVGLGSRSTLTQADADAVAASDSAVQLVTYMDRAGAEVVAGNRNWTTGIQGTTPNYFAIRDWQTSSGRLFTDAEDKSGAPVCVLGQTVVTNLFAPNEDPLGQIVRVKHFPLRVIGVLETKGQSGYGQDQDDVVMLPFNTAERKVIGVSAPSAGPAAQATATIENPYSAVPTTNSVYASVAASSPFGSPAKITGVVNVIYVQARSAEEVDNAVDQVTQTLHQRHRIQPGQDDDFTVRNLTDIAEAASNTTRIMTMLLAAVASISLLVGGIGIMNIMLVSVTERTREIGIRMAIGARRIHIMLQFLVEAVLLSALGGLAGALLGIVSSKLISFFAHWPTLISPAAIGGGFIFAAAVGVFFGYYPARKASLLHPIDALRYE
ncbi:MAG TPA: ABC transporter permease, partial [Candidatus Binataceae bacterium]|nr:ABC transporter permease [Candidatus Binataceae bacterium]